MATSLRSLKVPLAGVLGTLKYGSFRSHAAGFPTLNSTYPCTLYVTVSPRASLINQKNDKSVCRYQHFPSSLMVCHASGACAPAFKTQDSGIQVLSNYPDVLNFLDNIPLEVERPLQISPQSVSFEIIDQTRALSLYGDKCMKAVLRTKQPVTVFSGYLDCSPYKVYCINGDRDSHSSISYVPLSDFERQSLLYANSAGREQSSPSSPAPGRPSEEQLQRVHKRLADTLPNFFVKPHDYSLYQSDVVFQNNIRGVTTQGIAAYVQQLALVRIIGHLMYAHVKLEVLKITAHKEDGTIRIRWRIVGIPGFRVLFMFWKFKLWQWKEAMSQKSEWIDGFSVLHLGSDGKIYKHVCDKMMPDEDREKVKPTNMAVKLALLLGLTPQQSALECFDLNVALQSFGDNTLL